MQAGHTVTRRARDTTDIPQEILLRAITCIVGPPGSYARDIEEHASVGDRPYTIQGLGNLARVCRAWYRYVSPALYSKLQVTKPFTCSNFRPLTMENVRMLSVRHTWPESLLPRTRDYPCLRSNLLWLRCEGSRGQDGNTVPTPYNPSFAVIYWSATVPFPP